MRTVMCPCLRPVCRACCTLATRSQPDGGVWPAAPGNFLEHCDYLGAPFQRRKIENFIRQKIDGNWIPPPDQGLFQDNWAKNTATLLARVKALLK